MKKKSGQPDGGQIKINCDASAPSVGSPGVGCIARDDTGDVCLFAERKAHCSDSIEILEAEALLWAMEICLDQGITHAIFVSDSLSLITELQKKHPLKGPLGVLLSRIHCLQRGFEECSWAHNRRNGNKAAHLLANQRPDFPWIFLSPLYLQASTPL